MTRLFHWMLLLSSPDTDSPNFDSGWLRAELTNNGLPEDRLAIRNEGTGAGQIDVADSNVTYGGIVIGSYSGGSDGSTPLIITFTAQATPEAAQALLRNLTYKNTSEMPSSLDRTPQVQVADGSAGVSHEPFFSQVPPCSSSSSNPSLRQEIEPEDEVHGLEVVLPAVAQVI